MGGVMKLITAIIKPSMLDDVQDTLIDLGVKWITIAEVRGFGAEHGHTEIYRGSEYAAAFVPRLKIEVVSSEDRVQQIVDAIVRSARTGTPGDGMVVVCPIDQAILIHTGAQGGGAL